MKGYFVSAFSAVFSSASLVSSCSERANGYSARSYATVVGHNWKPWRWKDLDGGQYRSKRHFKWLFCRFECVLKMDVVSRIYGAWTRKLYHHFSFEDEDFDPFKLPTGSPRGSGGNKRVLVIMDECAEWVDQYSSAKDPKIARFWSWLRHSSKRSQDVLLIVQRLEYLNKVIRLLISKWVIVDDLRVYRLPVIKMRMPFMGGWCMQKGLRQK